jgi:peptide/nickel transport system substrate-binding protein
VTLEVSVAGRLSIRSDGVLIDEERFPGRQGRLVFAYLVANEGRPVLRADLAEALWGEALPATWEKALGVIASKLRALIGECGLDGGKALTAAFGCYCLVLPEGTWVDIIAAAEAADAAEAALSADRLETAKGEAARAVSLARRPLLPGEEGSWVERERRKLSDVLVRALECLSDACLRSGDTAAAARTAEEAIALEPFRESNYRRLMAAYAAGGNAAEALRTYDRCRRFLAEELGAYPSPETESVYRSLLQVPSHAAQDAHASAPVLDGEPVGRRRRPPRRRAVAGASAAAAVVASALGILVATQTGGPPTRASVHANRVGILDPTSGRIVAETAVGAAPGEIAVASGGVWVTSADENSVSRIDPATDQVRQTIEVGAGPADVAVGGGAVWVANGLDGTVSRIDPAANRVVQTVRVGNGPSGMAYGEGAAWVTNSADGTVSRVDPRTGAVTMTTPAAIGASGIIVSFGRVWISSPASGSIVVLEPRSGRILRRIGVGVQPDALSAGAEAIWVANRADGTVSKIDPRSGAVIDTVRVGRGPNGIAAGRASVWVANGGDGSLSRIDSASGATVSTVRLGNPPQGVADSRDGVYVAVRSTGSEHRGGTLRVLSSVPADSIDPALAPPWVWPILTMTNDGLVGFRRVGGVQGAQLVPDLAVALPTPTGGGTGFTFQLRPGIRYSNGRLVQPRDFRRAIERSFELGGVKHAYPFVGIAGAERCAKGKTCDLSGGIVTDRVARTVTFHLRAADIDFLDKLALPPAFAVPPEAPTHDSGTPALPATGPYRIAAYQKDDKTLRLTRNPGFREWSADAQPRGYPDAISWSWRPELVPAAQARAVERGAADVALGGGPRSLPRRQLERLALRHPARVHMNAQRATTYFFLNTRVSPFDDVRARRAVNLAFDRDSFAQVLGPGFTPTCQILPPNFPAYRTRCPYASNGAAGLDRARRLVRIAGSAGARVAVWVPAPLADQGRFLVSVLDSIGYRAHLEPVPPHDYFRKVADSRTRPQTGYYTWSAEYPSAADFIPPQLSCAAFVPASAENGNLSEFCDRRVDAVIARAAREQDSAVATASWQRAERALLAQAPVVPVFNRSNVDFVSERVGNYEYNPQWGLLLAQVWVR